MDRGAWQATVHGVTGVGRCLVTEPPPPPHGHVEKCTDLSIQLNEQAHLSTTLLK